ncbi:DUF7668 domain-containing protein [Hymenobacter cellulosilyticus]|uniref:DUF7668 domain-containing protein n=1 Tax=Hymenobacter cellulosilyticus TaxID=2932248 RepID=A0A8T9Q783_9BACT|nr:hypothetical protein [Hymenobacter cellulosilyticus]UOQ73437.1 hypothetical protein MUN79_05685 [Hymenobacter cellulosilyticus]
MNPIDFTQPVKQFVDKLVDGEYDAAVKLSFNTGRLNATHVAEAIRLYPGQLTHPPVNAYDAIEVYEYYDGTGYMLEFFLWVDEAPSELMIKVDARWADTQLNCTLFDIYVP